MSDDTCPSICALHRKMKIVEDRNDISEIRIELVKRNLKEWIYFKCSNTLEVTQQMIAIGL